MKAKYVCVSVYYEEVGCKKRVFIIKLQGCFRLTTHRVIQPGAATKITNNTRHSHTASLIHTCALAQKYTPSWGYENGVLLQCVLLGVNSKRRLVAEA